MTFLEALVTLLPTDAGGRALPVALREGSYRPYARLGMGEPLLCLRFIEGPPLIAPGQEAWVVVELESDVHLAGGSELDVLAHSLN